MQNGRRQVVLKGDISGLDDNPPFRVPNPIATALVLISDEKTHSHLVIKLPQAFLRFNDSARRTNARRWETSGFSP